MPRRSRLRSTTSAAPSSATRRSEALGPDGRPGVALTLFATLYELLLGQERGPRFGSFVAIYGIPETRALIEKALAGELAQPLVDATSAGLIGAAFAPEAELRLARLRLGVLEGVAASLRPALRDQPFGDVLAADDARRRIGNRVGARRAPRIRWRGRG